MQNHSTIHVRGAREHNLKNVTVAVPRERFVVMTGLSGSGKSSLAFDTIYAEGQRKYVESLSAYARQFLEQLPKPDVDGIDGLPPTIAIEQRSGMASPRSTVATTTEIYDFLRLLYARLGQPTCWECGKEIRRQSVSEIVDTVMAHPEGTKVMVLSPLVRGKKGTHADAIRRAQRQGFVRVRIDGQTWDVKSTPELGGNRKHTIEAVVDRLVVKPEARSRLADSIELSVGVSDGQVIVTQPGTNGEWVDQIFSTQYACAKHPDVILPELTPRLFSFNNPHGACDACSGLGTVLEFDADLIIPDRELSLTDGAVSAWRRSGSRMNAVYNKLVREFCACFGVSPDTPFGKIPEPLRKILMHGTAEEDEAKHGHAFEGVIPNLRRRWENTDSPSVKQRLHAFLSESPCEACNGVRLRPEATRVLFEGKRINDICAMSIESAEKFFAGLKLKGESRIVGDPIIKEVLHRLKFMSGVGIGYLTLDRTSSTLSGGEAQRIRLATQIGSGLVGVLYVLDEPTIGLHQRDTERLVGSIRSLVEMGNSVVVVEHDEEVIRAADHVIDVGPKAGAHGGEIVVTGSVQDIVKCDASVTGAYLRGDQSIEKPKSRRKVIMTNSIEIVGAHENNLKNIDVTIPLNCFVCVTGVSGSGKSTLVNQILLQALRRRLTGAGAKPGAHEKLLGGGRVDTVVEIDQSPIGRTPRSNPATYTGVFDLIRELYAKTREAKIRGYSPGRFSFNVRGGRCEPCQGQGTKKIEMHFLPDMYVVCDVCKGSRYNRETLEVKYRGLSVADVLNLRVDEALRFFDSFSKIKQGLQALFDVGLGYVTLGQASTTLSGGEAQRVKLAAELCRPVTDHTLYILDEPTTGLHVADIHRLLNVLNRLADIDHTILVIEHNLDVIKMADWVIDLGPEGGDAGGEIVATGRPEDIAANPASHTGRFLKGKL